MKLVDLIERAKAMAPPPSAIGLRYNYANGSRDFFSYRIYGNRACRGVAKALASGWAESAEIRLSNGQLVIVRPKQAGATA